jgi:SAM-dependent methyltransferase
MGESQGAELYHGQMVAMLQVIWGEGFLSPGGPQEVARLIADADLTGLSVLDIGCGAGGIDLALVRNHGAGYVTGLDVEDTVLARAREVEPRDGAFLPAFGFGRGAHHQHGKLFAVGVGEPVAAGVGNAVDLVDRVGKQCHANRLFAHQAPSCLLAITVFSRMRCLSIEIMQYVE